MIMANFMEGENNSQSLTFGGRIVTFGTVKLATSKKKKEGLQNLRV